MCGPLQAARKRPAENPSADRFYTFTILQHLRQEGFQSLVFGVGEELLRGLVDLDDAFVDEDDAVRNLDVYKRQPLPR